MGDTFLGRRLGNYMLKMNTTLQSKTYTVDKNDFYGLCKLCDLKV